MKLEMTLTSRATLSPVELEQPHQAGLDPTEFPDRTATMTVSTVAHQLLEITVAAARHWRGPHLREDVAELVLRVGAHGWKGFDSMSGADALLATEVLLEVLGDRSGEIHKDYKEPHHDSITYAHRTLSTIRDWSAEDPDGWWSVGGVRYRAEILEPNVLDLLRRYGRPQ
jgi:hypothetical protein